MNRLPILTIITTIIIGACPSALFAQAEMKAGGFILSDLNFGSETIINTRRDSRPPAISPPTVTDIEPRKATIEWVTDKKASSTVKYGTAAGKYDFENGSASFTTTHKVNLFGLDPETTYFYKVVSTDTLGATGESVELTFTTPADAGINTIQVSDVSYDKALITWKTGNATVSRLEYGKDTGYGSVKSTSSGSISADHTVQLTELTPGTEYHFRIVAENAKGTLLRSTDQTFKTIALPKFESVTAVPINSNEVEIGWVSNTPTTGIIKYKAKNGPKIEDLTAGDPKSDLSHKVRLKNLIGSVDYGYSIIATDQQGKQVDSGERIIRTPVDDKPPVITDLKVSVTRSGDELILRASWRTNEPSKGEMVYGPKNRIDETVDVPGPESLVTEHTLVATGLKAATPYGLTAFTTDPAGNRGAAEISFVSPRLNRNIFQLIIDSFFSRFGWLLNLLQERAR